MSQRYNTPKSHTHPFTRAVTDKLRRELLAKEIPNNKVGDAIGITRQTTARRFKTQTLSLDDFLAITDFANINPAELINDARREIEATK